MGGKFETTGWGPFVDSSIDSDLIERLARRYALWLLNLHEKPRPYGPEPVMLEAVLLLDRCGRSCVYEWSDNEVERSGLVSETMFAPTP